MFTSNPFAELSSFIPPEVMQTYIVVMIILVAVGTLYDIIHKRSAKYFVDNWRNAKAKGGQEVGGGDMVSLAVQTVVVDGLTSGEFCDARRRIAHLLTMYGFLIYVITTVIMVFCYPTSDTSTPTILPQLWCIGALLVCLGGYWFWFFIRVDVVAEGNSPFRIICQKNQDFHCIFTEINTAGHVGEIMVMELCSKNHCFSFFGNGFLFGDGFRWDSFVYSSTGL